MDHLDCPKIASCLCWTLERTIRSLEDLGCFLADQNRDLFQLNCVRNIVCNARKDPCFYARLQTSAITCVTQRQTMGGKGSAEGLEESQTRGPFSSQGQARPRE